LGVWNLFGTRVKGTATVTDVADHIDRAVRIEGIDRVEIGCDFDGVSRPPNGLDDVSKMPALIEVLLDRRVIREVTNK
jgi:membrane dipeptidase